MTSYQLGRRVFFIIVIGMFSACTPHDPYALMREEPYMDDIKRQFGEEGGDVAIVVMGPSTSLLRVTLADTSVTDEDLEPLRGLVSVVGLDVSNTEISDGIIDVALAWKKLKDLDLSGTKISDQGARRLKELSILETLDLTNTSVSADTVAVLQKALRGCSISCNRSH